MTICFINELDSYNYTITHSVMMVQMQYYIEVYKLSKISFKEFDQSDSCRPQNSTGTHDQ